MKILIIGSFYWEMYAPAFYKAWGDMGHTIKKIDYNEYRFKNRGIIAEFLNRIQSRYHVGFFMSRYNRDIITAVDHFNPDFVFLYRCYHVYGETINMIRRKTVVFSYNNDDPFSGIPSRRYFRHYYEDARHCHLNYVYRTRNIEDFKAIGVENTTVLLPYFRKDSNYAINCKKDIPLAFLGHFENDGRDKFILGLKEAGVPVVVYGDAKWKDAPLYEAIKDVVCPDKRGKEYNLTINRCQVCLVFFSKLNHDTYTRRCFEIPAAKTVMLCEYTDDMDRLFPDGESAVYFRNMEELVEKAKELLNNETYRNDIAQNAYARLQKLGGSEYDRCRQILEDWRNICKK